MGTPGTRVYAGHIAVEQWNHSGALIEKNYMATILNLFRKLNIYNVLIKRSLLYCVVPKHGDSQKIIRDGSKLQRWMP